MWGKLLLLDSWHSAFKNHNSPLGCGGGQPSLQVSEFSPPPDHFPVLKAPPIITAELACEILKTPVPPASSVRMSNASSN